jgi:hypothetical protein
MRPHRQKLQIASHGEEKKWNGEYQPYDQVVAL